MAGALVSAHQASMPGGIDQASTHATVRQGTKRRARTGACAAATTTTGSSRNGTNSVLPPLSLTATAVTTAIPHSPTPTEASREVRPRHTAYGP